MLLAMPGPASGSFTQTAYAPPVSAAADFQQSLTIMVDEAVSAAPAPDGTKYSDSSAYTLVGNGTADDTVALQAFFDSVASKGRGYLAPGTYRITAPIYWNNSECTIASNAAVSSGTGARIYWDGASTSSFALYMTGYSQVLDGISIAPPAPGRALYGGIHIGSRLGSLNTRCEVRNSFIAADSAVGASTIQIGVGVAMVSPGAGNQDFNKLTNVIITNCLNECVRVEGNGNTIHTTLERVACANYMGVPAQRKYVAAGLSDGLNHSYGVGVYAVSCNSVVMRDVNFSYLETGFKVLGVANFHEVDGIDSEETKKLFACDTGTTALSGVSLTNGRCIASATVRQSLGPDGAGGNGYAAGDHYYIDSRGYNLSLSNLSMTYGDNNATATGPQIHVTGGDRIFASNCVFGDDRPFVGSCLVTSWNNSGSGGGGIPGAALPVASGVYEIGGGHAPTATHFDAIQYIGSIAVDPLQIVASDGPTIQATPPIRRNNRGSVTITDASATTNVALSISEANTSYAVKLTPIAATGAPASAGSYVAIAKNKAVNNFDAIATVIPSAGTSVTFEWEVISL